MKFPKGVFTRSRGDWAVANIMGGSAFQAGAGALLSYVELYNNANDGSSLIVLGLQGWAQSASSTFFIETYKGQNGTPATSPPAPIDPSRPYGPGQIGTFTRATCIGNHIFEMGGANLPYFWPYQFPVAVVPAGYSLALQAALAAVAQQAAFYWTWSTRPY